MKRVLLVDRPHPFRKNGVGRYLLEVTAFIEQRHPEIDLRVLYLGRELSVARWRATVLSNAAPIRGIMRLNRACLLPLALWRSSTDLVHYPLGNLHPRWDVGQAPRLLTLHGMGQYLSLPWYQPWQRERAKRLRRRFEHGRRQLRRVIAVSEFTKAQAVEFLTLSPDLVEVITHGVDRSRFFVEKDLERVARYLDKHFGIRRPYLFHLGPGGPRKNVRRQLEAFARLKHRLHIPHKLVLAGLVGQRAARELRALASRLKVSEEMLTVGEIRDDEQLRMLYNGADLFLFPSLYESVGIPIWEAMACGTPVITSNLGGLPETSGDAAALVDEPREVDNLVHVIQSVLEDGAYRQLLRERGLVRVQQYRWEASAAAHLRVYRQILAQDRP